MKRLSIMVVLLWALMLALPSSVQSQQVKNALPAVASAEQTRAQLELELAKRDQLIAELKREIVQMQRQLLDLQTQNLNFVSRDVESEKKAADVAVDEKQKKAQAEKK